MPLVNSFAGASARGLGLGAAGGLPPFEVAYVVVAGGGGGAGGFMRPEPYSRTRVFGGGGGGGGGFRSSAPGIPSGGPGGTVESLLEVDAGTNYTVTVGAGGGGGYTGPDDAYGYRGNPTTFASIVSFGGGSGGNEYDPRGLPGIPTSGSSGGVGAINPVDARPSNKGYPGGNNYYPVPLSPSIGGFTGGAGTGGGGATAAGIDYPDPVGVSWGTNGGNGRNIAPFYPSAPPSAVMSSGGGGGSASYPSPGSLGGDAGTNAGAGGNAWAPTPPIHGGNAVAGYGGGGGGGAGMPGGPNSGLGGNGAGGSIILRIPILYTASFSPGVSLRSPSTATPTHRFYDIITAGPSDTVTFAGA